MNTNDYIDLTRKLTGTPAVDAKTEPQPLAPVNPALEIAKRHADQVKDLKPDVVPSQGAFPVAN